MPIFSCKTVLNSENDLKRRLLSLWSWRKELFYREYCNYNHLVVCFLTYHRLKVIVIVLYLLLLPDLSVLTYLRPIHTKNKLKYYNTKSHKSSMFFGLFIITILRHFKLISILCWNSVLSIKLYSVYNIVTTTIQKLYESFIDIG